MQLETKVFIESIIRRQNDTATISYAGMLPAGYLNEKIVFIKTHSPKFIEFGRGLKQDSIVLTKREKNYLLTQLKLQKARVWEDHLLRSSVRISADSILKYLQNNRSKVLYLFSHPIFFRNNSICLFISMRLCCGGINGPDGMAFYKRAGAAWKRWITIQSGDF